MDDHRSDPAEKPDVYGRIRSAILERKLRPGTRLKEEQLAEVFEVSRARVRQALVALKRDGLVSIQPNRGAAVAKPTIEDAQDVFYARRVVEPRLVERLCAVRTPEMVRHLRAHVEEERVARRAGDSTAVVRLSGGFHILLGSLAGSPYLGEVLRDLVWRTSLIVTMYQNHRHEDCGPDEHDTVVSCIEAGDAEGARKSVEEHLRHIEATLDLSDDRGRVASLQEVFR